MPHPHRSYDDEGDGLAVILLHGYPFNRSMWREQIGSPALSSVRLKDNDKLKLIGQY